jgi:U3 small nucleolar RNA-associated protein 18
MTMTGISDHQGKKNKQKKGGDKDGKPKKKKELNAKQLKQQQAIEAEQEEEKGLSDLLFSGGPAAVAAIVHEDDDVSERGDEDSDDASRNHSDDDEDDNNNDDDMDEDEANNNNEEDFNKDGFTLDRVGDVNTDKSPSTSKMSRKQRQKQTARAHALDMKKSELKPAWQDAEEKSAQTQLTASTKDKRNDKISLTNSHRAKKFRLSQEEKGIDTEEYAKRLRERHETLTTIPTSWAFVDPATTALAKATAAKNPSMNNDDVNAEDDMDEVDRAMSRAASQLLSHTTGTTAALTVTAGLAHTMPAGKIGCCRKPDVNILDQQEGNAITSSGSTGRHFSHRKPGVSSISVVKFHPTQDHQNLVFTASAGDGRLKCYNLNNGTGNGVDDAATRVLAVKFPSMKSIAKISFLHRDASSMVITGLRRNCYFIYDITSGTIDQVSKNAMQLEHSVDKWDQQESLEQMTTSPNGEQIVFASAAGGLKVVDHQTRQVCHSVKMNGSCNAIKFSPCSNYLTSAGSDGHVYTWDLRFTSSSSSTKQSSFNRIMCTSKMMNEDGTPIRSLAISTGQQMAVGSDSGVVNIYDAADAAKIYGAHSGHVHAPQTRLQAQSSVTNGTPLKSFLNLRTPISGLQYNHDSQILAMWSHKDATAGLKLIHTKSQTVFANWPTPKTPLNHVTALDFSVNSNYMAIGNEKGKCMLYELAYFN